MPELCLAHVASVRNAHNTSIVLNGFADGLQLVGRGFIADTPEFKFKPKALIIGQLEGPRGAKTEMEECQNGLSDGWVPNHAAVG